jgi:hypothetical protein
MGNPNQWVIRRPVEAFGETKNIAEWSRDPRCVVPYQTLWNRLMRLYWPLETALTTPLKKTGRKPKLMGA